MVITIHEVRNPTTNYLYFSTIKQEEAHLHAGMIHKETKVICNIDSFERESVDHTKIQISKT
jgi:hypothetical protein